MLKLSRTGIGLLSAQYRSVLKKCLLINLASGMLLIASPAKAVVRGYLNANADATITGLLDSDFGNLINGVDTGDSLHNSADVVAQGLAVFGANDTFRKNVISMEAWIRNEGSIGIGYTYNSADYSDSTLTEYTSTSSISNVHSIGNSSRVNAGSVLMNNDITNAYSVPINGYEIKIDNTTFSDNTKSFFSAIIPDIYGGVIGNVRDSDTQNAMQVTNSTFSDNYAMSNGNLKGGVFYNGSVETQYGTSSYKASNAYIYSSNNTYSSNGAYNNDLGVTSGTLYDAVVKTWVEDYALADAQNAYGGVAYNESSFVSVGDTYSGNRAVAQVNAYGGALYNTIETYSQSLAAGGGTWTTQGILTIQGGTTFSTFNSNSVITTSANAAESPIAGGGAILNHNATASISGDVRFSSNSATTNAGLAAGGAIVNFNGVMTFADTQNFTNNQANTTAGTAYGGAIAGLYGTITNTGQQTFSGNSAASGGGAIGAISATITNATSGTQTFSLNSTDGSGGAIYNDKLLTSGNFTNAGTQTFTSNSAFNGGAIYNATQMTNTGTQNFYTNTASYSGGALYNSGTYTGLSGTFKTNAAQTTGTSNIFGGAVFNSGNISMSATQTFEENEASAVGGIASGGAIYNHSTGNITAISSLFKSNQAISSGSNALGGAVYNAGNTFELGAAQFNQNSVSGIISYGGALYNAATLTSVASTAASFTNNSANSSSQGAYGGAIYNNANGITTLNSGTIFSANQAVLNTSSAGGGNSSGGAIFNVGTMNFSDVSFSTNSTSVVATSSGFGTYGGAIYNEGNISFAPGSSQSFTSNSANSSSASASGGAVYNAINGNILGLNGNFTTNLVSTTTENAIGGAIANYGNLAADTLDFNSNSATSSSKNSHGGAVYNDGVLSAVGKFTTNNASGQKSYGGALYSKNTLTLNSGSKFDSNYVSAVSEGRGGALAVVSASGNTNISGTSFSSNYIDTQRRGYGGAIYNENKNTLTTLTDVLLIGNSIEITESTYPDYYGYGGAIYNEAEAGDISRLEINSIAGDVNISNNSIAVNVEVPDVIENFYGGAIYNGNYANTLISTSSADYSLSINSNSAAKGGAIYNKATGANVNVGGTDYNASLTISAINGNINIKQNVASQSGGALYNNSGVFGKATLTASSASLNILANSAAQSGGAIYNDAGSTLMLQVGDKGIINISENTATKGSGGAIYNNASKIVLGNASATLNNASYSFSNNTAVNGGAIYNAAVDGVASILSADLTNTSVSFVNNTATSGLGGAIYNDKDSTVDIKLSGSSSVNFATTKDDVYNLGKISFSGDLSNPTLPSASAITSFYSSDNSASLILNSTFGGSGVYNIANTNLQLGSSGYIDYEPVIKLSNNVVSMAGKSYINLSSKDTLINNDFKISQGATLTYNASDAISQVSDISLANTINNAGMVDVADNVLTTVSINTLDSNDGTIKIDVHDANASTQPLKADVIKINNRIYGTTNVVFANSDNVVMLLPDRIYFAQTQAAQDLSDYAFNINASNPEYKIYVGHETNGAFYDWFLYRRGFEAQEVAYIDLPRAAIEQSRNLSLHINRTNRGECNCHRGICDNRRYCNYTSTSPRLRLWATPFYRSGTYDKPVETDFSLRGAEFGLDYQPSYRDLFGLFGSYRHGKYEHDGHDKIFTSEFGNQINITSKLFGAYYRKYIGDLYMVGALYGGENSIDIKGDNGVNAKTKGLDIGALAEVGYDIRTSRRSLLTPMIKASYDYIKFDDIKDSNSNSAKIDDTHDIELEAGLKFEYAINEEYQLPTTVYIKPSVIKTISKGGKVTINGIQYSDTLEDETIGRIEIGSDAELVEDTFAVGAFGNYNFGSGYKAWAIGGNVRLVW